MDAIERLAAIEAMRQAKARYWRGVDTHDGALVRSALSHDCVLDYRGCCTDPSSGVDHLPAMNIVIEGRDAWPDADVSAASTMTSAHAGHDADFSFDSDGGARSVWSFSDRLWFPEGAPLRELRGWGHYHESWVRSEGDWLIRTLRITRIRVESA